MELSSVYVSVTDMDRAIEFYRELFDRDPEQEEKRYSTFEVGAVEFGNNCVPNFEVDDVDAAYERIERTAAELVHEEILEFGDYRTFHFVDSEGNEIEVFSIDAD